MFKLGLPLTLIAVAALTACAARERVVQPIIVNPPATSVTVAPGAAPSTTAAVQATSALRAGIGRIESIAPAPSPLSASAGGAQPSSMRRVGVRMDDGTLQYIDTNAPSLRVGDRIEITSDGFIRQPAQ